MKKEIRKKHRKKDKIYESGSSCGLCIDRCANNDLWKRNSEIFPEQMETEYFPNGSSGNKGEEVKTKCIFGYTNLKQYEDNKEKSKNETWYAFKNQKINNKDFLCKVD